MSLETWAQLTRTGSFTPVLAKSLSLVDAISWPTPTSVAGMAARRIPAESTCGRPMP
jgi:hypothetical protein